MVKNLTNTKSTARHIPKRVLAIFVLNVYKPFIFYTKTGLTFYRAMHFSAERGLAIACRLSVCLSVCNVGGL